MKYIRKGTNEDNGIRLTDPIEFPNGTPVLENLTVLREDSQEVITERQLKFLEKGFNLGKKLYSCREDIYRIIKGEKHENN